MKFVWLLILPQALAIASKRSKINSFIREKKLRISNLGVNGLINKTLPENVLEPDVEDGKIDNLSISMKVTDYKEKTAEFSKMVRYRLCIFFEALFLHRRYPDGKRCDGYIVEVRGGARNSRIPFIRRCSMEHPSCREKEVGSSLSWMDEMAEIMCYYTGLFVGLRSFGTILSNNNFALVDEIADRLLSRESAQAVKTIRTIIDNFPHHGVIDIFSLYPTKDIISAIIALSRLQRIALYAEDKFDKFAIDKDLFSTASSFMSNGNDDFDQRTDYAERVESVDLSEQELLYELAHYSAYAHAAYGWKLGLLSGRVHLGDKAMLLRKTGLSRHDVIHASWKSKTHLPAHFLMRDVKRKTIVLCIRGTLSPKDVLTDLCCTAEDFSGEIGEIDYFRRTKTQARAHHGMLESARGVAEITRKLISSELASRPEYDLIIVGHSLGGGVAAILASLWQDTFPGLKVYAYGCPCVGPIDSEPVTSDSIVSVVSEGDPFSRLSLGHLADATSLLSKLCDDRGLRELILNNTKTEIEELEDNDLRWCMKTMDNLKKHMTAEKFYPPGRVLYMRGDLFGSGSNIDDIRLDEVDSSITFDALRWHPRMFDLSLHIPHRYEVLLSRIWEKYKHKKDRNERDAEY